MVPAAVDEERGRPRDPAGRGALDVVGDPRPGHVPLYVVEPFDVEAELLGAAGKGLPVPEYVLRAFRAAVEAAYARRSTGGRSPSVASA